MRNLFAVSWRKPLAAKLESLFVSDHSIEVSDDRNDGYLFAERLIGIL